MPWSLQSLRQGCNGLQHCSASSIHSSIHFNNRSSGSLQFKLGKLQISEESEDLQEARESDL